MRKTCFLFSFLPNLTMIYNFVELFDMLSANWVLVLANKSDKCAMSSSTQIELAMFLLIMIELDTSFKIWSIGQKVDLSVHLRAYEGQGGSSDPGKVLMWGPS